MNPSCNLFLVGPMGAGKTSIGRRLAPHFGLDFVDLDENIESAAGTSIPRIFAQEGETGFRALESRQLQQCSAMHGIVLATGGGVVLAADNRGLLLKKGFVVYLDIDVEQQLARLRGDRNRPLLDAPDRRARLEAIAAERNPLYASVADLHFVCGALSLQQTVAELAQRIDGQWQRLMTPEAPA